MFKGDNINKMTLPLDTEQFIPETDVVFTVDDLVEAVPCVKKIRFCLVTQFQQ